MSEDWEVGTPYKNRRPVNTTEASIYLGDVKPNLAPPIGSFYFNQKTGQYYMWDDTQWLVIGK
jgi:hypothetical protein